MEPYNYMANIKQVAKTLKDSIDNASDDYEAAVLDKVAISIANDLDCQDSCFNLKLFLNDCGIPTFR